jgi:hypothetical protein
MPTKQLRQPLPRPFVRALHAMPPRLWITDGRHLSPHTASTQQTVHAPTPQRIQPPTTASRPASRRSGLKKSWHRFPSRHGFCRPSWPTAVEFAAWSRKGGVGWPARRCKERGRTDQPVRRCEHKGRCADPNVVPCNCA